MSANRFAVLALALLLAPVVGLALEGFERIKYFDYRNLIKDGFLAYQKQDYARAFPLLRRNACGGDKQSQFELGGMYLMGQGTEPDALKAYAWMRASAESGDLQFKQAADKLAASIPPLHRESAQMLANTILQRYGLRATGMSCTQAAPLGSHLSRVECRPPVDARTSYLDLKMCEE
jgi:TPR repeat protein